MKRLVLIFLFPVLCFSAFSQVKPNERLVFSASYEISGLMTNIAQVTLQTENVSTSKNTFLHLSAEAATFSKWDSYFKIHDLYESYVHPTTLKPSLYKRNVTEGSYTKTEKYLYNSNSTINSVSKRMNRPERKSTFKIGASTVDIVALLYKVRYYDFSKVPAGKAVSFILVFDEKEIPVWVKVLGKEIINNKVAGKKECYKLSIGAKTNKLKGTDKNLIWITTDTKRLPLMIKFSIPVGVGQLILSGASGI